MCRERLRAYEQWLALQPLGDHTRRAYLSRVGQFLELTDREWSGCEKVLADEQHLSYAAWRYRCYLKARKAQPATINSNLTAIEYFCRFLGKDIETIGREEVPPVQVAALTRDEQLHYLGAIERCRPAKEKALALILFYTGIRIGEAAALNVEDIILTAHTGKLLVRARVVSQREQSREVPLNSAVRKELLVWLIEREKKWGDSGERALFVNQRGHRMTTAGIDFTIRKIGWSARLKISARLLRDTCLTNLLSTVKDPFLVAKIAGYKGPISARRYSSPDAHDLELAMENLLIAKRLS